MGDRAIIEMVEMLKKNKNNENNSSILFATVESIEPLAIRTNNVVITKNLYMNPCYMFEAQNGTKGMETIFEEAPSPPRLFGFLKEYHIKYIISPGDTVIVVNVGTFFYVMEKVVKLS